jgi:response regulator RpfG family c-di-GMP phosphodiesterase
MAFFSKQSLDRLDAKEASNAIRHTVMIVDDKPTNLSVMAAILRPHYHLLEAGDGQEALNVIEGLDESQVLACVISDYRMPHCNGVELLEQVQQRMPQTTRIIVTGYIDADAIIDSINKAGIFKLIVKPFAATDFLLAANSAVEKYEQQQQYLTRYETLEAQVREQTKELEACRLKLSEATQALQNR